MANAESTTPLPGKLVKLDAGTVHSLLDDGRRETRLPRVVIWSVMLISVAPALLMLIGVDFDSATHRLDPLALQDLSQTEQVDALHRALAGSTAARRVSSRTRC